MQNDGVDKRDTETIYDEALGDRRSLIIHGSWKTRRRSVNFLNAFISCYLLRDLSSHWMFSSSKENPLTNPWISLF
jgi:hypothetical protein